MEILSRFSEKPRVRLDFGSAKSRTKQSFQKECDINLIMAKYQKSGAISHFSKHSGEYGFANSFDFQEAMNMVSKATSMFMDLPSSIRTEFHGDPGEFLDFVDSEGNEDRMIDLGLMEKPEGVQEDLDLVAVPEQAPGKPIDKEAVKKAVEAVEAEAAQLDT